MNQSTSEFDYNKQQPINLAGKRASNRPRPKVDPKLEPPKDKPFKYPNAKQTEDDHLDNFGN